MGSIFIAGANFIKVAYIVINNVYYDMSRNIMFNTNSQVTVVSYMYCYIVISLNLISKVIIDPSISIASVSKP